ncbi:UDP-Glc:alpha-D-GlcNAc-diphosphoundecaprenol beta-1,3-glucosyltransferase WfgD [Stieleria maiorica]|uniref:UDP-Glc:alpha-D-GlcNAc-diphosphoundecaprenol beta-1,3-glucosyltransferase WfgD n=1 Tax=Stieleria maiorica TaxID=2795974 RepID=A0A5B9MQF3_9BACT|nr:glycosyltransferase [Stieleria maiorica]QEG02197.1 UDP-Glc:alpha-D-GlcNAc-diphosphoundecaprenol beta-1,3-glucosyltransferase WfgD [Stieleria maiorica]
MMASNPAGLTGRTMSAFVPPRTRRTGFGRVSVIIPTYNCARYIAGALQSVATQAYADLEIVVVDDGSNDDTSAAVDQSGVPCTYLMNQRSKGPAGARNQGIQHSDGDYIAFLDADDAWLPNKLNLQLAALQADRHLVAVGGVMIPWDDTSPSIAIPAAVRCYSFDEMILRNRLGTPTVVCRRDALTAVGLFDEQLNISEDYDLWLRLSRVGAVGRIETPLARYRQRPDGISAGNRDRTFALDMQFARSLPGRYADVPGIGRLVQRGLSARELERAIELCDVERRYWKAFCATVRSIRRWPWTNPLGQQRPLTRLRRVRRIMLDAVQTWRLSAANRSHAYAAQEIDR